MTEFSFWVNFPFKELFSLTWPLKKFSWSNQVIFFFFFGGGLSYNFTLCVSEHFEYQYFRPNISHHQGFLKKSSSFKSHCGINSILKSAMFFVIIHFYIFYNVTPQNTDWITTSFCRCFAEHLNLSSAVQPITVVYQLNHVGFEWKFFEH